MPLRICQQTDERIYPTPFAFLFLVPTSINLGIHLLGSNMFILMRRASFDMLYESHIDIYQHVKCDF